MTRRCHGSIDAKRAVAVHIRGSPTLAIIAAPSFGVGAGVSRLGKCSSHVVRSCQACLHGGITEQALGSAQGIAGVSSSTRSKIGHQLILNTPSCCLRASTLGQGYYEPEDPASRQAHGSCAAAAHCHVVSSARRCAVAVAPAASIRVPVVHTPTLVCVRRGGHGAQKRADVYLRAWATFGRPRASLGIRCADIYVSWDR